MATKQRKFRKGTPVLVVKTVNGRLEVIEAQYEFGTTSGRCHQVRTTDGRVVQCYDDELTKAA